MTTRRRKVSLFVTLNCRVFALVVCVCVTLAPELASGQMHWEKVFDSLSYKLTVKPAPRRDAAIGHDIQRNRVIVFGGWQTSVDNTRQTRDAADEDVRGPFTMPVLFDDTWEFNLLTSND